MNPSAEEVAAVLDQAHDELLVRGWCRGKIMQPTGEVCANGAITAALDPAALLFAVPQWPDALFDADKRVIGLAVVKALGKCNPVYGGAGAMMLSLWNDTFAQSVDDVLDLFRHTAKMLRNGELEV